MILFNSKLKDFTESYISSEGNSFECIYNKIQKPTKEIAKKLLIYFDKILDFYISQDSNDVRYIHIHFEHLDDYLKDVLFEFLTIKFFYLSITEKSNNLLQEEVKRLRIILNKLSVWPEGVSASSREGKSLRNDRYRIKVRKKIYESVISPFPGASIEPTTLINILQKERGIQSSFISELPYCSDIEEIDICSGVILNTNKDFESVNGLKSESDSSKYLLDSLKNIILFDCESQKQNREFSYKTLLDVNENGGQLENLVLITFGNQRNNFSNLKSNLDIIEERFLSKPKCPNYHTYTVLENEVDLLFGKEEINETEIKFFDDNSLDLWADFIENVSQYEDLYELISIKMKNIYSLVLNVNIKEYVLNNIFSEGESNLLTNETKDTLFELMEETIDKLKGNLSLVLDSIISSQWSQTIKEHIGVTTAVLLPTVVIKDNKLCKDIKLALCLSNRNIVINWHHNESLARKDILILDYRDLGKFPFTIKSNVFNQTLFESKDLRYYFLKTFFENKYRWSYYNVNKEYLRLLENDLRLKEFEWNTFYKEIANYKPSSLLEVDWNLETSYDDCGHASIQVEFTDSSRSYYPSELFIYSVNRSQDYKVCRCDELIVIFNKSELIKVQQLEDIYKDFNIYEKLANIDKEQSELDVIWGKYGLKQSNYADNHRLWKILLSIKSDKEGSFVLYKTLKEYFKGKGVDIISRNTYESSWININSEALIPRSKKMFGYLCEFLEIPKSYIRIMLRRRNSERQAARSSSVKMNRLLYDLINSGYFNDGIDVKMKMIQDDSNYYLTHELDELGMDESSYFAEIEAFVSMIKENVSLTRLNCIYINE